MANRHKVLYLEAPDQYAGTFPIRSYFSDLINIILTNLNERDSINRIRSNPDNSNNKAYQLSGIEDKYVERTLTESRQRVSTEDTALIDEDMNRIINVTADLIRTISPIKQVIKIIDCPYSKIMKIVPSNISTTPITIPETTMGVEVKKSDILVAYKKVSCIGFSTLAASIIHNIVDGPMNPFGSNDNPVYTYTINAVQSIYRVSGLFTVRRYNDASGTTMLGNPVNYIVVYSENGLPETFTEFILTDTVTNKEYTIPKADFSEISGAKDFFKATITGDPLFDNPNVNSTKNFKLKADVDDELAVAADKRICTLPYDASNPSTVCANRGTLAGFNLIRQNSPGSVTTCSTNKRKVVEEVSNPTTDFSIPNVGKDEVVFANKWTQIYEYLRRVSSGLDSYSDWWDDNGYCARSCQTHCQQACQLSCQGCFSNTCHNQHCGGF